VNTDAAHKIPPIAKIYASGVISDLKFGISTNESSPLYMGLGLAAELAKK
jgi:hypothetical protein